MRDWIPVSERLPEGIGKYLVWMPYASSEYRIGIAKWCDGYWNVKTPISAWMPLPEPWKGAGMIDSKKVIDSDKLIDAINNGSYDINLTAIMALGATLMENNERNRRWISVGERMPEEEMDVLVCNEYGEMEVASGSYSTEFKDFFIWYTSGWRFGKVIAWMPLPKPYTEERRTDDKHNKR